MAIVLAITFSGCASTTIIRSHPQDAKVYINDEYVGNTPHSHTDTSIVGSTKHVRLEKEGCENLTTFFNRNEEVNVGALIGGLFVLVPFLWIMDYKPERTFEMKCGDKTAEMSPPISP